MIIPRFRTNEASMINENVGNDEAILKPAAWLGYTVLFTTVFLGVAAGFGLWHFGSIGPALAYLSGERVIVDSRSKSIGTVKKGDRVELQFGFSNHAKASVNILGAQSSCSCALVENTPISIPPGETKQLKVVVSTAGLTTANFAQSIKVFTDFPSKPVVTIAVTGTIMLSNVERAEKGDGGNY